MLGTVPLSVFAFGKFSLASCAGQLIVPAYINRAAEKLAMGDKPGVMADLLLAARRGHEGAQQWLSKSGVANW
ncbi:MAG: hypothetical protein ACOYOE_00105 [Chlorobium sp.]